MEIVDEYTEVRRKYWKREPKILASGRILTLCLATIAVLGYLAILIVFIARSNTIVVKNVIPTDTVPAADLSLSFNYKFNVSCQFRQLDGSLKSQDICAQYLTQPCNKSDDGRYYGYFTALDNFNYSLPDGRYGIWFTFFLDDTTYTAQNDLGLFVRAYDSGFDPRTLEPKVESLVRRIDPNFFNRLDEANAYVVGAKQNNWMFVTRTIKKKMKSTFGGWLGIPPSYYNWPFLQSRFESVADPVNVFATLQQNQQIYGHLFVGTLDWYTEENIEIRTRTVLDGLALISGFYLLVVGIYVCLFGASPILPWGLCQSFCMRKKVKENIKSQYPKYIPLVDPIDSSVRTKQRLQYLETFLKDYVVDVDVLRETEEEEDVDGLTPDEKNEIDASGGGGGGVYNPDDVQFGEVPPIRTKTDKFRESDGENLLDDDEEEFNLNKPPRPSKFSAIQAGISGFAGAGFGLFKSKKDSTEEIEATQYESTSTAKEPKTILAGVGAGRGSSGEKNTSTFVATGENPNNFNVITGADAPVKKEKSSIFSIFGRKGKKSAAAGVVAGSAAVGAIGVVSSKRRRKRRGSGSTSERTSVIEKVEVVVDDSNPGVETITTTTEEVDVIETTSED
ncbi:6258_t:CDS:2 [Paraglomus brasilianum]|uniref:6258_t:CDS:1 n=1 Tax=Paraglomus brasilianum TaxID=144538 RepID=A0A9N8VZS8_9GLOM|nr:6258_t:CDS:2 [Paraglomus brasilianum]